jgi:hypothetical protein
MHEGGGCRRLGWEQKPPRSNDSLFSTEPIPYQLYLTDWPCLAELYQISDSCCSRPARDAGNGTGHGCLQLEYAIRTRWKA